jgi:hypothetical protein
VNYPPLKPLNPDEFIWVVSKWDEHGRPYEVFALDRARLPELEALHDGDMNAAVQRRRQVG